MPRPRSVDNEHILQATAEAISRVADRSMQILGGLGMTRDTQPLGDTGDARNVDLNDVDCIELDEGGERFRAVG